MNNWFRSACCAISFLTLGTAHAVQVVQNGPGFTESLNADETAGALAAVYPGIGYAKLFARAWTNGTDFASSIAVREINGTGVILNRIGGLGDPQVVRATIQGGALLAHALYPSPVYVDPQGCCGFEATLSLQLFVEREAEGGGFFGNRDFEIDIVDKTIGRIEPDGSTAVNREVTFFANGDGVMLPGFEQAYMRGLPMPFSFLLPEGGEFRVSAEFDISLSAFANQPPGYECGSVILPQGFCVAYPSAADVIFDASHSLYWGGLELVDDGGQALPFDFVAVDGFDLGQSYIPAVPEPSAAWMFIAAVPLLAFRRRRRG